MTTLHKHKHWSHHLKPRLRMPQMNLSAHRTEPNEYTQNKESARRKLQIKHCKLKVENGLTI